MENMDVASSESRPGKSSPMENGGTVPLRTCMVDTPKGQPRTIIQLANDYAKDTTGIDTQWNL